MLGREPIRVVDLRSGVERSEGLENGGSGRGDPGRQTILKLVATPTLTCHPAAAVGPLKTSAKIIASAKFRADHKPRLLRRLAPVSGPFLGSAQHGTLAEVYGANTSETEIPLPGHLTSTSTLLEQVSAKQAKFIGLPGT